MMTKQKNSQFTELVLGRDGGMVKVSVLQGMGTSTVARHEGKKTVLQAVLGSRVQCLSEVAFVFLNLFCSNTIW